MQLPDALYLRNRFVIVAIVRDHCLVQLGHGDPLGLRAYKVSAGIFASTFFEQVLSVGDFLAVGGFAHALAVRVITDPPEPGPRLPEDRAATAWMLFICHDGPLPVPHAAGSR